MARTLRKQRPGLLVLGLRGLQKVCSMDPNCNIWVRWLSPITTERIKQRGASVGPPPPMFRRPLWRAGPAPCGAQRAAKFQRDGAENFFAHVSKSVDAPNVDHHRLWPLKVPTTTCCGQQSVNNWEELLIACECRDAKRKLQRRRFISSSCPPGVPPPR